MLEVFDIVKGAVAKDTLVPILSHLGFNKGVVYAANGRLQLSAPCDALKHLSLCVPAEPLLAALRAAGDKVKLQRAKKDDATYQDLAITGGRFKASIPSLDFDRFVMRAPVTTKPRRLKKGLLAKLTLLREVIGEDASRPWAATMRIGDGHAIATNNVIVASIPVDWPLPTIALPVFALDELIRLGIDPDTCAVDDLGAVFKLPGDIVVHTSFLNGQWPDALKALDAAHDGATLRPVDCAALCDAIDLVTPFCEDPKLPRVKLENGVLSALGGAMRADISGFTGTGAACMTFHVKPLLQALTLSQALDWDRFPRVPFTGAQGIRGVILGVPRA